MRQKLNISINSSYSLSAVKKKYNTEYRKKNIFLFSFCCGQEAVILGRVSLHNCNCFFFIPHLSGFLLHVVLFDERSTVGSVTVFE